MRAQRRHDARLTQQVFESVDGAFPDEG
jgi:hypothetical protein